MCILHLCMDNDFYFQNSQIKLFSLICVCFVNINQDTVSGHLTSLFRLLSSLHELRIDRNALTELPNSLRLLSNLQSLQAAQNRIERLPEFLLGRTSYSSVPPSSAPNMKTMGLVDAYSQKVNNMIHNQHHQQKQQGEQKPPLNRISLRSNQLKGNIILGNYGVSLLCGKYPIIATF